MPSIGYCHTARNLDRDVRIDRQYRVKEECSHATRKRWSQDQTATKKAAEISQGSIRWKSRLFRTATESVDKGQQYAYVERKKRKRNFRNLWVARINAAVRAHGLTYSRFMNALKVANIGLDRKVLSDMAIKDPSGFQKLTEMAKQTVPVAG